MSITFINKGVVYINMLYNMTKFKTLLAIEIIDEDYKEEATPFKISVLTHIKQKYLWNYLPKYKKLGYVTIRVNKDGKDAARYSYHLSKKGRRVLNKFKILYESGYSLHLKSDPVKTDYNNTVILPGFYEFECKYNKVKNMEMYDNDEVGAEL